MQCSQIVRAIVKSIRQILAPHNFQSHRKFAQKPFPSLHAPVREAIFQLDRVPLPLRLFVLAQPLHPIIFFTSDEKKSQKRRKKPKYIHRVIHKLHSLMMFQKKKLFQEFHLHKPIS